MTILQKYRALFADGGKGTGASAYFQEIEEQVEKEAVLQEESVCEATDRKQAETGSRVYDAEQGKIVHLSSEIPKVSRNTAQTAEGRAFTSGLRENRFADTAE